MKEQKSQVWIKTPRVVQAICDMVLVGLAYLFAFALRFDFGVPRGGWRATVAFGVVVCFVHLAALSLFGCYRRSARRFSRRECKRCLLAMASAALLLTVTRFLLGNELFFHARSPYSVTIMTFFFGSVGLLFSRWICRDRMGIFEPSIDLLERPETSFDNEKARTFVAGRTILVTGAGGTIGSEIVRQIAALGAKRILLVERCENALYNIDREMRALTANAAQCVPLMLDVCDKAAMEKLMAREKPSVILHAAAYKHVPMVELNPEEGWRNNVEGTRILAEAAERAGVARFVLISTDKAVNPVSVMGKSKRAAEKVLMGLNDAQSKTSFCAVRFGNVFGSSGSVVPLFKEQIAAGGPVTVTDPEMKRYFMTVQEAVSLVLQAASRAERAIYTLEMGACVSIVKLAEGLVRRAGYRPYKDIPIIFTGIRPGEKLFEELDVSEKSAYRTDMAKIYITKMGE